MKGKKKNLNNLNNIEVTFREDLLQMIRNIVKERLFL